MKKSNQIKDYLTYSWYVILLISVLSYALSYYLVSYVNEYSRNEIFSIFVTSYGIKDNSLKNKIKEKYISFGIEQVNVYNFSYEDKNISSYYSNFGVKSDLIILYEKDLDDMKNYIQDYYLSMNEYSNNYQMYKYEDNSYGIKIYEENNQEISYLNEWFNFDGEIKSSSYILINNKSPHFDTFSSIGYNILNDLLKGEI